MLKAVAAFARKN